MPFTEDELNILRERFVGNECDTDEYRETQPQKGMQMIAALLDRTDNPLKEKEIFRLLHDWTEAALQHWGTPGYESIGYAGAQQLGPLLVMYFDELMQVGEHPYGDTEDELREQLKEG